MARRGRVGCGAESQAREAEGGVRVASGWIFGSGGGDCIIRGGWKKGRDVACGGDIIRVGDGGRALCTVHQGYAFWDDTALPTPKLDRSLFI